MLALPFFIVIHKSIGILLNFPLYNAQVYDNNYKGVKL